MNMKPMMHKRLKLQLSEVCQKTTTDRQVCSKWYNHRTDTC